MGIILPSLVTLKIHKIPTVRLNEPHSLVEGLTGLSDSFPIQQKLDCFCIILF